MDAVLPGTKEAAELFDACPGGWCAGTLLVRFPDGRSHVEGLPQPSDAAPHFAARVGSRLRELGPRGGTCSVTLSVPNLDRAEFAAAGAPEGTVALASTFSVVDGESTGHGLTWTVCGEWWESTVRDESVATRPLFVAVDTSRQPTEATPS